MANNYPMYPNYYYVQSPNQYQNQQSYTNSVKAMEWVEGEVGAKAYQMPVGWPVNTPIPLWDSIEKKIYLKSWNQMGMANPLQELDYEIKDNPMLMSGSSYDMSQYITKNDFNELKQEIKSLSETIANMQPSKNRGAQQ